MHEIEWIACFAGLLGSALLAMNNRYSKWGFVAFLASNVLWFSYGWDKQVWGLVTMQIGFTVTSVVGIKTWFSPSRYRQQITET
jgi:hypothetical protein